MFKKPKKSDYTNLETYKSIILLNTIKKILEIIILNRIKYIIKTYNLFSNTQYDVRTDRVTKTVLQQITKKIYTI